eukprot:Skav230096  [mRNA]  locus=scaffold283:2039:36053:- [translate_table: standard]
MLMFVDDLNMPRTSDVQAWEKDLFGSQPPLELLRQWVDYGCWYDRQKQTLRYVEGIHMVSAMGPPGGGRAVISARLQSAANNLCFVNPADSQIKRIFMTLARFLPTPEKCHYLFNLRDIAKIFQGVYLADPKVHEQKEQIVRMWYHECCRVFMDRLINQEETIDGGDPDFVFAALDLTNPEAEDAVYEYMQDRTGDAGTAKKVTLTVSNALLIGVGGSGRHCQTRLASFIAFYKCFSIEITKQHLGQEDLDRDADTEIVEESFLEDVANMLSSGEVPNLFTGDELSAVRANLEKAGKDRAAQHNGDRSKHSDFAQRFRELEESLRAPVAEIFGAAHTTVITAERSKADAQQAQETKILADDATRDLEKAMPALDAAVDALEKLDKKSIAEGKLVDGLAGEKIRWTESLGKFDVQQLDTESQNLQKLPADDFSTENGDIMKSLERAIEFGSPVLLENVGEELDPSLEPILAKNIIDNGGGTLSLKVGDNVLDYNPQFMFYITTKLSNPHYTPEVNFIVVLDGLTNQLLGVIVRNEDPRLEEDKNRLLFQVAKGGRNRLVELENEILRLLAETKAMNPPRLQGSLLDDLSLIDTLQESKVISNSEVSSHGTFEKAMVGTPKLWNMIKIDGQRENYRPAGLRSAVLYFVLNDLVAIDPMYQLLGPQEFALSAYETLYVQSIEKSAEKKISVGGGVEERIEDLNAFHALAVYKYGCRAIFERHKLLLSLHLCAQAAWLHVLKYSNDLNETEFSFFLFGGQVFDRSGQPANPSSDWISQSMWDNIVEADSKLESFKGQRMHGVQKWYSGSEPEKDNLPGEWHERLDPLQILDSYNRVKEVQKYRRLFFSLCWFHAILLERKKFKMLGWNIGYDFNDSDFDICENILAMYLDENPTDIPWDAIRYLIAEAEGRLKIPCPKRSYVNEFFCVAALQPKFQLSSLTTYYIPEDLQSYRQYVQGLPLSEPPEAFGQHTNAEISSSLADTDVLMQTMIEVRGGGGCGAAAGGDIGETVFATCNTLLEKLPENLDWEEVRDRNEADSSPLKVCLLQERCHSHAEIERYNDLLSSVRGSIKILQKGIQGLVVISKEQEAVLNSLYGGTVPTSWLFAYPSLKPLSSWMPDLADRIEQLNTWGFVGEPERVPKVLWLGGLTYPTSLLTAVLQQHLGAKWDLNAGCLADADTMALFNPMPIALPYESWLQMGHFRVSQNDPIRSSQTTQIEALKRLRFGDLIDLMGSTMFVSTGSVANLTEEELSSPK